MCGLKYFKHTVAALSHSCRTGVGNLRPARTFDMTLIIVNQVTVQHRVKTKLHDTHALGK